jgi:hypothetical protein
VVSIVRAAAETSTVVDCWLNLRATGSVWIVPAVTVTLLMVNAGKPDAATVIL